MNHIDPRNIIVVNRNQNIDHEIHQVWQNIGGQHVENILEKV